jgi:hypothetical protein
MFFRKSGKYRTYLFNGEESEESEERILQVPLRRGWSVAEQ